jgi:hypothetical protein
LIVVELPEQIVVVPEMDAVGKLLTDKVAGLEVVEKLLVKNTALYLLLSKVEFTLVCPWQI